MKKTSGKVDWGIAILLGLFFVLQGVTKFVGPAATQWAMRFAHWGYPAGFHHIVGVFEIASGLGLFFPRTRRMAAVCLIVIMAGAFATHFMHREFPRLVPPLILGGLASFLLRRPGTLTGSKTHAG